MLFCPPISKILEYSNGANLYLGSIVSRSVQILRQSEINLVVSIVSSPTFLRAPKIPSEIEQVAYFLDDHPQANILQHFLDSSKKIFQAILDGKNVLVHCHAGISRSTSLVVAYLLYCSRFFPRAAPKFRNSHHLTENILELVRSRRPCVNPNEGFIHQLKSFEMNLF